MWHDTKFYPDLRRAACRSDATPSVFVASVRLRRCTGRLGRMELVTLSRPRGRFKTAAFSNSSKPTYFGRFADRDVRLVGCEIDSKDRDIVLNELSIVTSGGNMLNVVTSGTGPVLMFIHGFPLDQRMWAKQYEFDGEYQVVAPDMRGFGRSSVYEQYTLAELAEDIEVVRNRLSQGKRMVLCGLSMGGYIAFEYWKRYSENLDALVLANTKPTADPEDAWQARRRMAEQVLEQGTWETVRGMLPKIVAQRATPDSEQVTARTAEMMAATKPSGVAYGQLAMAQRTDFSDAIDSIDIPTLVMTGEFDPLCPPDETRRWASRLPSGQCEVIEGAGHLSPMETPDVFNDLLARFLKRLLAGASQTSK